MLFEKPCAVYAVAVLVHVSDLYVSVSQVAKTHLFCSLCGLRCIQVLTIFVFIIMVGTILITVELPVLWPLPLTAISFAVHGSSTSSLIASLGSRVLFKIISKVKNADNIFVC